MKPREIGEASHVLPPEELHVLQHSLGLSKYGKAERWYRNHFCTSPGSDDFDRCTKLVAAGFMQTRGAGGEIVGGMHTFTVTMEGIKAVEAQSPAEPKVSRSKQRYRAFLRSDGTRTFGEWLKDLKHAKEVGYSY